MYDPIQIWLNSLQSPLTTTTTTVPMDESSTTSQPVERRLPFVITLPAFTLSVAMFAETWEYDDGDGGGGCGWVCDLVEDHRHASILSRAATSQGGGVKAVGVLEKKANIIYIGGGGHKGMRSWPTATVLICLCVGFPIYACLSPLCHN